MQWADQQSKATDYEEPSDRLGVKEANDEAAPAVGRACSDDGASERSRGERER